MCEIADRRKTEDDAVRIWLKFSKEGTGKFAGLLRRREYYENRAKELGIELDTRITAGVKQFLGDDMTMYEMTEQEFVSYVKSLNLTELKKVMKRLRTAEEYATRPLQNQISALDYIIGHPNVKAKKSKFGYDPYYPSNGSFSTRKKPSPNLGD